MNPAVGSQNRGFDEQSGPALVTAAVWAYHAVVVARPLGDASIQFT